MSASNSFPSHDLPSHPPSSDQKQNSIDPTVHNSITQYCALHRDQILLDEHCKLGEKRYRDAEQTYKSLLKTYVAQTGKSCIPVPIKTDPSDEKSYTEMYLRVKTAVTKKSVSEKTLEVALSKPLTVAELDKTFQAMKNEEKEESKIKSKKKKVPRDYSFKGVYSECLFRRIEELNTSTTQTFYLDKSKEREVGKGKGKGTKRKEMDEKDSSLSNSSIHVPKDIQDLANQLYRTQYDHGRMRAKKKQKITKINKEKEKYEPQLASFLKHKPQGHQSQKVVMKIQNVERPYFLRHKVSTRKGALTLPKAREFLANNVEISLENIAPSLTSRPYNSHDASVLLSPEFHNDVITTLKENLRDLQEATQTRVEKISLDAGRVVRSDGSDGSNEVVDGEET